jgi:hypothetical protein
LEGASSFSWLCALMCFENTSTSLAVTHNLSTNFSFYEAFTSLKIEHISTTMNTRNAIHVMAMYKTSTTPLFSSFFIHIKQMFEFNTNFLSKNILLMTSMLKCLTKILPKTNDHK